MDAVPFPAQVGEETHWNEGGVAVEADQAFNSLFAGRLNANVYNLGTSQP
jgi:hypothetical protein